MQIIVEEWLSILTLWSCCKILSLKNGFENWMFFKMRTGYCLPNSEAPLLSMFSKLRICFVLLFNIHSTMALLLISRKPVLFFWIQPGPPGLWAELEEIVKIRIVWTFIKFNYLSTFTKRLYAFLELWYIAVNGAPLFIYSSQQFLLIHRLGPPFSIKTGDMESWC